MTTHNFEIDLASFPVSVLEKALVVARQRAARAAFDERTRDVSIELNRMEIILNQDIRPKWNPRPAPGLFSSSTILSALESYVNLADNPDRNSRWAKVARVTWDEYTKELSNDALRELHYSNKEDDDASLETQLKAVNNTMARYPNAKAAQCYDAFMDLQDRLKHMGHHRIMSQATREMFYYSLSYEIIAEHGARIMGVIEPTGVTGDPRPSAGSDCHCAAYCGRLQYPTKE